MAYTAARFPTLGLGTCVLVTPWYHPIRLAEEIADAGRADAGKEVLQIEFEDPGLPRMKRGVAADVAPGQCRETIKAVQDELDAAGQ